MGAVELDGDFLQVEVADAEDVGRFRAQYGRPAQAVYQLLGEADGRFLAEAGPRQVPGVCAVSRGGGGGVGALAAMEAAPMLQWVGTGQGGGAESRGGGPRGPN